MGVGLSFAESSVTPPREASTSPSHGPVASPAAQTPGEPLTSTPVAAAVASLDTVRELPLAQHPDVYQRIHTELQGALADIDDA